MTVWYSNSYGHKQFGMGLQDSEEPDNWSMGDNDLVKHYLL